MKLFKHILYTVILMQLIGSAHAQEFSIKKIELTASSVILHYDLVDTTRDRLYSIYVYSSKDNFIAPLQKINGDAGLDVRPGLNKKIVWQSYEELGATFDGDIELEIRGRVYIPFIRFTGLKENMKIRRGVPKAFAWIGGTSQNVLSFQLYRNDELIHQIPPIPNTSKTTDIELPLTIKPGKGYRFVVSDVKNKDLVVKTSSFMVTRKYPMMIKVISVATIGVATWWFLPKEEKLMSGPPPVPATTD